MKSAWVKQYFNTNLKGLVFISLIFLIALMISAIMPAPSSPNFSCSDKSFQKLTYLPVDLKETQSVGLQ